MRILHAMLAPGKGGIEFAFVRWTQALRSLGHEVISVTGQGAAIIPHLSEDVAVHSVRHAFDRDPLAIFRLKRLIKRAAPDIIITHGNRAGRLLRYAHGGRVPHLAVLHRPRFKGLEAYSAIACITHDLMRQAEAKGIPISRLHYVPNFLTGGTILHSPRSSCRTPPVIGVLGRFVPEKGIDLLIEALPHLSTQARVIIGGDGPERPALEAAISRLRLQDRVTLSGWVEDVDAFYRSIDLLCVPSRSESFGLIILEAWAHGVPVIATRTSGPLELIVPGRNGFLCEVNAEAIEEGLQNALSHPAHMSEVAGAAQQSLQAYRMENIAPRIQALLDGLRK